MSKLIGKEIYDGGQRGKGETWKDFRTKNEYSKLQKTWLRNEQVLLGSANKGNKVETRQLCLFLLRRRPWRLKVANFELI